MKLKRRMCKKYFIKRRMKSISQVEYFSGPYLVQVSQQFAIEMAIIEENSSCLKLAYSSLLQKPALLNHLGICGNIEEA